MSKSIRNTLALVLLALLLATCAPATQEPPQETFGDFELVATTGGYGNVWRFIDTKADVACWLILGMERGGISCLPLSDTALEPPR